MVTRRFFKGFFSPFELEEVKKKHATVYTAILNEWTNESTTTTTKPTKIRQIFESFSKEKTVFLYWQPYDDNFIAPTSSPTNEQTIRSMWMFEYKKKISKH